MSDRRPSRASVLEVTDTRTLVAAGAEVVVGILAASGIVAALQSAAPPAGLGSIYLLAVLEVAVRRGQVAALVSAVLSFLTLNYFFIAPRGRLEIAHTADLVELLVFLIVAVVVGRLAAAGRQRAAEAEDRAREAAVREREATLLAEAASGILAGRSLRAQLETIGSRVALATGASSARVVVERVPSPRPGELTVRLAASAHVWLHVCDDAAWPKSEVERLAEPLGRLIEVAIERERLAEQAAENEAASRAQAARTAILHAISHDLRSPLTAITTAASALRSPAVNEAERGELIDAIDSEGQRLAKLVDDLLDLSKIQAGAVLPRADWCDLQDIVTSAAGHLQGSPQIEFALPPDLPLVRADAAQLERVFSNLLENAVKFSPPGVPVKVSGGTGGGRVTVRVTDRGRGIPSHQRSRVFEPFFRGRGEAGSGSGLGLAICRGFVEANGGRILLQAGTDQGTSFAVSFPVERQPIPAPR